MKQPAGSEEPDSKIEDHPPIHTPPQPAPDLRAPYCTSSVPLPVRGAGDFYETMVWCPHTPFGAALGRGEILAKVKHASGPNEPRRAARVLMNVNYESCLAEGLKPCSVLESPGGA